MMRRHRRDTARFRPGLPRRTARLRLTALYGGLFLVSGAVLLVVTYLLVEWATSSGIPRSNGYWSLTTGPAGANAAFERQGPHHTVVAECQAVVAVAITKDVTGGVLRQLLIRSPIALAIVTVVAIALGWAVAGRILRPISAITGTARRISASNLNERLNLQGPDDELKALGDTLDGLFTRLEASFEAQRHFVANASHELRTPVTRERTMLQVALDDPGTTAETWRSTAREVLASNAEQESLIEALLTLASSEGDHDLHDPVDLSAVTGRALLAPRPEIGRLDLHVVAITEPAALHGDPLLVERLVANLIDNAVRHNVPSGSVQITTGTTCGRAFLSVVNTGPVVPPDTVDRLFQPFQQLVPRRAHTGNGHGLGLGLSIVKAIAASHGATVTAQSRPGGGLAIDVTFPPPAPPQACQPQAARAARV